MRIIVCGSTGFVGKNLVKELLHRGHEVIGIHRTSSSTEQVKRLQWDTLKQYNEKVDAIINVAGVPIAKSWTPSYEKQIYDSRVETSKKLMEFARQQSKEVVMIGTSAIGIYPAVTDITQQKQVFDENSKEVASNKFGHLCNSIESTLFDTNLKSENIQMACVRPSVVLGADGGVYQNLLLPFSLEFYFDAGTGRQPFAFIHMQDLINIYIRLLETKDSWKHKPNYTVNAVAPDSPDTVYHDLTVAMAKHVRPILGVRKFVEENILRLQQKPSFVVPFPNFVFDLALGKEGTFLLTHGQRVKSARVEKELNYSFQYPSLEESILQCTRK